MHLGQFPGEVNLGKSHQEEAWDIHSEHTCAGESAGGTYDVAGLAVRLLLHGVEGLSTQFAAADHAHEAVHMEDLVHGSAAGALTHHVLPTAGTAPWGESSRLRQPRWSTSTHIWVLARQSTNNRIFFWRHTEDQNKNLSSHCALCS